MRGALYLVACLVLGAAATAIAYPRFEHPDRLYLACVGHSGDPAPSDAPITHSIVVDLKAKMVDYVPITSATDEHIYAEKGEDVTSQNQRSWVVENYDIDRLTGRAYWQVTVDGKKTASTESKCSFIHQGLF
jgi:hypothetical protein